MTSWDSWLEVERERREQSALERRLQVTERPAEPIAYRGGKRLVNLSSNNYLGLAGHPRLIEAAAAGAARGAGSGSSRLVAGNDPETAALEEKVAAFKGSEAALLVGSGYLANVGVIAALCDRDTAVFADRLNHASIVDGVRLSGAQARRYRHRDLDHLASLLEKSSAARKLIVSDTIFSMDGDTAPLAGLVELKERYGALLQLDDAHGGAVFGAHGEGYAHELGLADRIELQIGTFSKGFGVYGAYVAADRALIDHLVSTCRTLIYSTALPPAVVAAIDTSIDLVTEADDRRRALREKSERFRTRLAGLGFDTGGSTTQIVPAIVGSSERALELAHTLEQRGVLAVAIRPPTVPTGGARIRFSLMATHADADLELALEALAGAV
ncbi:MAG: 8-amino-7-oxononanoate synthase [Gaiellaceae bacterium]|jgi:8-amino-7-oxononanoate synthase